MIEKLLRGGCFFALICNFGFSAQGQRFSAEDEERLETTFLCDELDERSAIPLGICIDLQSASAGVLSRIAENALLLALSTEAALIVNQENQASAIAEFSEVYLEHLLQINLQATELLELEEQTPHVERRQEALEQYRIAHAARDAASVDVASYAGLAALSERIGSDRNHRLRGRSTLEGLRGSGLGQSMQDRLFGDQFAGSPRDTSMDKSPGGSGTSNWKKLRDLRAKVASRTGAMDSLNWFFSGFGLVYEEYSDEEREADEAEIARLEAEEKENPTPPVASDGSEILDAVTGFFCDVFGFFCDDDASEECPPDQEECEEGDAGRLLAISCGIFGVCPPEFSALVLVDNGGVGACDPRTGENCTGAVDFSDVGEVIFDTAGGHCDGRGDDSDCAFGEEGGIDHSAAIRALLACPPDANDCGNIGEDLGNLHTPDAAQTFSPVQSGVLQNSGASNEEEYSEIPDPPQNR